MLYSTIIQMSVTSVCIIIIIIISSPTTTKKSDAFLFCPRNVSKFLEDLDLLFPIAPSLFWIMLNITAKC